MLEFSPHLLKRLQNLVVRNKRAVLGSRQGVHASHRRGAGLEFFEFKSYAPGDNFRSIDWGVMARTDKAYVRRYEEEQNSQILICIDNSSSAQFDKRIQKVGLSLAYMGLCSGDTVSVLVPGAYYSGWSRNPKSFVRFKKGVESSGVTDGFPLREALYEAVSSVKLSLRVFVVSDFLFETEDLREAFNLLRKKNSELTNIYFRSPAYKNLSDDAVYIDSETEEEIRLSNPSTSYNKILRAYHEHYDSLVELSREFRSECIEIDENSNSEEVIFKNLFESGVVSS